MSKGTREIESVCLGVVTAVAESAGVAPDELRPLHDVVDPDALETLFKKEDGMVTFLYEGNSVTVTGAGDVTLEPMS